eukprot:6323490-Amphidinium_carterae.1
MVVGLGCARGYRGTQGIHNLWCLADAVRILLQSVCSHAMHLRRPGGVAPCHVLGHIGIDLAIVYMLGHQLG